MQQVMNFTKGKILFPLIQFAFPILGALFLQTMYGAVDMMIVGQFSDASHVSAVSTGSWIMHLITSFIVGIAMGTTVLLGRKIGEGKSKEAGEIIGASIGLFVIIGIALTIGMELFAEVFVKMMQTPYEAFDSTVLYVRICSAGSLFIIAYNVIGSIFRGIGNSRLPLLSVLIACLFNIIGDYILVGYFELGASGAAIATVVAQILSVVLSLIIIRKQQFPFEFHKSYITFRFRKMYKIFKLGFPIAFQDLLVSISFLTIQAIVNTLGVIPSAGVGIAEKLCGFIMLVPSAFNQTMATYVSQNVGANQLKRAEKGYVYSIFCSLIVGMLMFYASYFHGNIMSSLFSNDIHVIEASSQYLKSYAIDCLLVSVLFCSIGYFNGRGKTFFVMIQGIIGAFLVRIPVSFFMSQLKPVSLFMVGLATPCSSFVQILLCLMYYFIVRKKDNV